ncbi:FecR family protein [Chitinophaga sancti]|uniref:FecR domain-containing protein n=1 Tax=Chitinophaga sancti TaxID=1004 RepID=A0A1K1SWR5_9BACT|nr:FecR family protein [Chitinophaga sancti]WQD61096.1 FecR domain-containing protein [Chitinophaga sancti]WQG86775.1 FecR domain-containing protein [Chitinophaga sancti]SFW88495.1 FecR family protein [Chitinophaga sancti]
MKYDQEYIYSLLLRKQLGDLTEVEDKLLQKEMHHNENVRRCWQEYEEAILYTDSAFLEDLQVEADWLKIKAILEPTPVYMRVLKFLKKVRVAAAIVLAIGATAAAYILIPARQQAPHQTANHYRIVFPQMAGRPVFSSHAPAAASNGEVITTDTAIKVVGDSGTIAIKNIHPDTIYQSKSLEWNTLTVPPRQDYHIELADGTEVHLNASSTLRFPFIFPGKTREVYLEGEAYFTVAHNPERPFIVHTGTTSVIALGTAFNVNSYDNNTVTTSLVQGTVVTDVGDSLDVTLKPGFEAIYHPGERFKVKRFDETVTLGWRQGVYRFRNKPMEELRPVLQRWFGLKMDFSAAPSFENTHFSGSLEKDKKVEDFLDEICKQLKLNYQIYDNTIHFMTKK